TKDEISEILKKFITEIENLKDLKVKIIRCDNGGEFRNKVMNDFCSQKGIKREFSNARTPQQNGVAKKRNRTLIEVARTMLVDAKLPVTFWAEVVNTACYVPNRVLMNKSQNKTSYELFNGRTPAIGFLKPFGCHVMILNTLDNLGKFDPKGDEGDACTNSTNLSGIKDAANQEVKKDPHDESSTKVLEGSGNPNPTVSSSNPPADQIETLTVESPIPTVSSPVPTACLNDSLEPSSEARLILKRVVNQEETPSLENILSLTNRFEDILRVTTSSDEAIGVEADVSNMETTISASPTPTLRIHKDHPKSQIIGPVDTPIQTRNKSKEVEEQSFIATIYQKTDPTLLQFCLFSCFLSQVEPKKVSDALQDLSWVLQVLEDREGVAAKQSRDDALIKRRSINEGEAANERISNDSKDISRVLTSMDAATVLAGGIDVPTGSGSIPTAGPPATKGKEVMAESDTPEKQRLQEQIDAQVSRELEEQQEKEDMRMNEQIARDAEVARIHVEDFIPMGSKEEAERLKRKGLNLEQEHVKKQKSLEEAPEMEKSTKEIIEEKMKEMMQLVPVEDVYVQALQVKHPIIDWNVHTEGQRSY
nr:putative ribonuclease H-like domain-containing protein [Tanacetum cinerariifolium]